MKLVITIAPSLEVVSLVKPLELKLTLQQIMEYIYIQNVSIIYYPTLAHAKGLSNWYVCLCMWAC